MPSKVQLKVLSGPIKGKVFEFSRHDAFLLGRGSDCHARLPKDLGVSRHHFLLEVNPPQAILRDLGSLNGTRVNGVRYGGRKRAGPAADAPPIPGLEVCLNHGDRIVVGKTQLLLATWPQTSRHSERSEESRSSGDPGQILRCAQNDVSRDPGQILRCAQNDVSRDPGQILRCAQNDVSRRNDANREDGKQCPAGSGKPDRHAQRAAGAAGSCNEGKAGANALPPAGAGGLGGIRQLIRRAAAGPQDADTPVEIEGYRLEQVLGRGTMGCVYRATRLLDDFPVAIKVMVANTAANDRARRRFLKEIDVIRELSHPNIATLIEGAISGKAFYFVSDYCNGGSLADMVRRRGKELPLKAFWPIMLQCLAGLEWAHQSGFVHRDLKPGNILLHQQGAGWLAKLADFGLAKQFDHSGLSGMTLTGTVGGTHEFMPREQLTDFRNTRPVSDVWSLAATFYWVLTGTSPRQCAQERDPVEVVLREKAVPIRRRAPSLPPPLAAVIDRSLAFDAKDRFQDAVEMHRAFTGLRSR